MICVKCGASNPSESAYCGACGSFLVANPGASVAASLPPQESFAPPSEPVARPAEDAGEDMPTFHTVQPAAAQSTPLEELPTQRGAAPAQPTPAASEVMNVAPANPQGWAGASFPQAAPASPAPGFPAQSGPLPAPGAPGTVYPQQGPFPAPSAPLYYPQQGAVQPGMPGGMPAPGFPGAIPGAVPVAGFPVAFPPQTPQPVPGAFPPATPFPPGFPSGAYAGQPQISGVFPPQTGEVPPGAFPGTIPGQSMPGVWPYGVPGAVPPPAQPSEPSRLIRPLPLWAFIGSIVIVAGLLAGLVFANHDWAAGAFAAGIIALVISVLILIAFGVRSALGMLAQTNPHRRTQLISAVLLTLLLILFGAVGISDQSGIHAAQAHVLESQGSDWQGAINQYLASGQNAPTSEDLARTYDEWGKQLVNAGKYDLGIAKFEIVTSNYSQAPLGFQAAKNDAINTYTQWADMASQAQQYDLAVQRLDKLLSQQYCDSACQSQVGSADATAYYKLAEKKLHLQPPDYAGAVAAFNQLTTRFSSSSFSQQAHADYAQALWGDGQQLLTTTCSSAVTIYQQLSSQFSDTSQGQQATAALTKAVSVKGHFTSNIPSGSVAPFVTLVQGLTSGMTDAQIQAMLAKAPVAPVNSNGDFVFPSIKQGSYNLLWGSINRTTGSGLVSLNPSYPAAVGPLCTFDFGDVNESFPKV